MRFFPRALGLLAIFYALGVWLLIALGPTGAGFMWLLLFSIMAGVLFGFTPALVSLGLNLITIAGLSVLVFKRTITWTLLPENEIAIWAVKSVNFICINGIVAASTGFIIARISRTAEEETRRRIQLDQAIQARIRMEKENQALTKQLCQSQKMEAMDNLPDNRKKRLELSLAPMPEPLPPEGRRLSADKTHLKLKVTDTGAGIAQKHLNRIFDPHFTTKKNGKGTGLGLSITHSIVQDHGGEVWVESTLGEGTAFTIILPTCE